MTLDRLKPALDTDIPGCLWILRFDLDGRAAPGTSADLERLGQPGEGFVWLHLNLTDSRTRSLIGRLRVLTEDARASLTNSVDHQFLEHAGAIVSGAFLDHELALSGRTTQTDFLRFALGPDFLISARRRPLNAAETTRVALSAGELAPSPLALFESIVDHLCDELSKMMLEFVAALDDIEDRMIDGRGRNETATLGPARHGAVRLARQIGGLRSIVSRLETAAIAPVHEELREAAARLAQRTDALAHDVLSVQDRARLLQEELNAILNLETNDRLYVLTVVTTLVLPATFITGYFGMNTKQLLFSESENGSIYATILCLLASFLVHLFMRRHGLTRQGDMGAGARIASQKPSSKERFAQADRDPR